MAKNQKDQEVVEYQDGQEIVAGKGYAKDKRKQDKKAAWSNIKTLVESLDEANKDTKLLKDSLKESLTIIRPSLYGVQTGTKGAFITLMLEKKELHENDIFLELKMGRRETHGAMKKQLRSAAPAERIWISFNPETGFYKVETIGEVPPPNWKGYIPVETEAIELL